MMLQRELPIDLEPSLCQPLATSHARIAEKAPVAVGFTVCLDDSTSLYRIIKRLRIQPVTLTA